MNRPYSYSYSYISSSMNSHPKQFPSSQELSLNHPIQRDTMNHINPNGSSIPPLIIPTGNLTITIPSSPKYSGLAHNATARHENVST